MNMYKGVICSLYVSTISSPNSQDITLVTWVIKCPATPHTWLYDLREAELGGCVRDNAPYSLWKHNSIGKFIVNANTL